MTYLKAFLSFLQGKKTSIATILGALIIFSLGRGYIQQDVADLLSYIMVALGLTVNVASAKLLK